MQHNILLIDNDKNILQAMSSLLTDEGFHVRAVESGDEGVALVRQGIVKFSMALVDYHIPGGSDGPVFIKRIQEADPKLAIFGFSGDDSDDVFNESLASGAISFISKDSSDAKILGLVHRTCQEVEKKVAPIVFSPPSENRKIIESLGWAGESASTATTAQTVLKFAVTDQPVLILGENGTGKELVAKAIHNKSDRANKRFLAVNIASISEDLIASELFGHEKGAFTGAHQRKIGLFQAADGGTIFLDEIGELPMHLQPVLLRTLQEKTITPVGSTEIRKVNFRLITATNVNLDKMIEQNKFRRDLYYRINILPIKLKPLCERSEDIPHMVKVFFDQACKDAQKNITLLQSTVDEMKKLSWPGNVRQLEATVIRMVSLAESNELNPEILFQVYEGPVESKKSTLKISDLDSSRKSVEQMEKELIQKTLIELRGNQSATARQLGVKRKTLADKIVKYGIKIANQINRGNDE